MKDLRGAVAFEPRFLDGKAGPLFAVHYRPERWAQPRRGVLYLPPFAEEMNRARRMAALQARALAATGCSVLLLDPYGTGDSAGDFREARWDIWQDDAMRAIAWLRESGCEGIALLGLRLGALLALACAAAGPQMVDRAILWQPVLRGDQMMTQFLRLRLAADLAASKAGENTAALRRQLAAGHRLEIAGYELNAELVAAIDGLRLAQLGLRSPVPIDWIELASAPDQPPSPARQQVTTRWQESGIKFTLHRVVGEPFWSLQETTVVPALVTSTTGLLNTVHA